MKPKIIAIMGFLLLVMACVTQRTSRQESMKDNEYNEYLGKAQKEILYRDRDRCEEEEKIEHFVLKDMITSSQDLPSDHHSASNNPIAYKIFTSVRIIDMLKLDFPKEHISQVSNYDLGWIYGKGVDAYNLVGNMLFYNIYFPSDVNGGSTNLKVTVVEDMGRSIHECFIQKKEGSWKVVRKESTYFD